MPTNPQWKIRLDAYHRFVVERFESLMESDRSVVIQSWIQQWVADHPEQVEQAGASLADWRREREAGKSN